MGYIYADGVRGRASAAATPACRKCGGFVTSDGILCARCNTRGDGLKMMLLGLIALQGVAVAGLYYWNGHVPHRSKEMARLVEDTAPSAGEVAAKQQHLTWFYYLTNDPQLNDTMRHATVDSPTDPAARVDHAKLELRSSDIYGRSAVLTLDRKASDRNGDQAMLAVTFDDRPAEQFVGQETASDDKIVVAVEDYARFATDMQGAHAMVVDAQLGADTERRMKFQVAGLVW